MKSLINSSKEWFGKLNSKIKYSSYSTMSMRNRYPCLLVGEKHLYDKHTTIIQYVIKSKRDTEYEISVDELLNDLLLIEKFHPTQAVKIGCIAMGDILCMIPEDQREQKYKSIMDNMLKTKGK